jgi:sulfur-carrier protein
MATVHLTRHLFSYFPALENHQIVVDAATVREAVQALDQRAPGIAFYLCDELGRLRTHVNIFVGKQMVKDRRGLSDPVSSTTDIHIIQALSGG